MNKENLGSKLLLTIFLLCFTLIIPLPGVYGTVSAGTVNSTNSTEDKEPEIKLNVKQKTLVKDTSYSLVLYNLSDSYKVNFKSSDNDIASVDKTGVVTAVQTGEATITVTIKDGLKTVESLTCDITVGMPAVSIKFNCKSNITLVVGKSSLLETILTPNNTVEEPKFSSMDPSIATVSSSGRITAKSVGTTYVFGTLGNGQFARISVSVIEEEVVPTDSPTPTLPEAAN